MATIEAPKKPIENWQEVQSAWSNQLTRLVADVETWGRELGWSTRRIEKRMEDSQIGTYEAPALLLQSDTVRVLLEPIARFVPGAEGVVDLYLMPAYDDIASIYVHGGRWNLHYRFPGAPPVSTIQDTDARVLSKDTLRDVLDAMKRHGT